MDWDIEHLKRPRGRSDRGREKPTQMCQLGRLPEQTAPDIERMDCRAIAEQLPDKDRKQLATHYADQAIALLQDARKEGFRIGKRERVRRELKVPHARPDFQRMLAE